MLSPMVCALWNLHGACKVHVPGHGVGTILIFYSLCVGWPARVPLVGFVHVGHQRAEEEPEAIDGEEGAAQHDYQRIRRCTDGDGRLRYDKRKKQG